MADNVVLNPGAAGDSIAADEIAGVKHQQVKVEFGADGVVTPVDSTNPLPVTLSGVLAAAPLAVSAASDVYAAGLNYNRATNPTQEELLREILEQLKILNLHWAEVRGETLLARDIDENS